MSNAQFVADISKFVDKANGNVELVCRKIALDVFRRVVMRTPVDTGRAKGNWQVTYGSAAGGVTDALDSSPKGSIGGGTETKLTTTALAWDPAEASIFLTNNLPYIGALEGGHSKTQAPAGMVKVTLSEYPGIVEVNARGTA